jgi:transposase
MHTANTIPFDLPGFDISEVNEYDELLVIHAHSTAIEAICPDCAQVSGSIHSHYTRSPRDLPCNGRRVRLVLGVRRFRCSNPRCVRKTFAERIPQIVPVHGQRTTRLTSVLGAVVLEVAAEAGARITQHLNMPMSADTMLRVVRQIADEPAPIPRVLGVDDWAFKKGKNYGTILVDQERQCPIDLLPDRTAETLEAWLKAHPGIEIITRDRSHDYIAGINAGAPQAIQIADRWHLLRNLSDALHRMLENYTDTLRTVAKQFRPQSQLLPDLVDSPPRPPKPNLRFLAVKELAQQGYTQRAIARHLNISRNTVKRYLAADAPPTGEGRGSQRSTITPFIAYLEQRWTEGCHHSRILWEENRQQGYPGSYGSVRRFVGRYREPKPQLPPPAPGWPRRQVVWLWVSDKDDLSADDAAYLDALCQASNDLATAYQLAQQFVTMVKNREVDMLDPWLAEAQAGPVVRLKTFAEGIRKDYNAVRAALEFEWSNGPVEGQVNRLKVIKRIMYGRANFDLLRLRVLHPP